MRIKNTFNTALLSLILSSATISFSYEIQPSFKFASTPVHEVMTIMAIQCLIKFNGKEPKSCLENVKEINLKSNISMNPFVSSLSIGKATVAELQKAVRWPDDPTRQLSSKRSLVKAGIVIKKLCKKYTKDITSGLFCSSHFGPLQFLHAMSSSENEKKEETINKMLDWSEFAFNVSIGKTSLNENYCAFFTSSEMGGSYKDSEHKRSMSSSLLPSDKESFICTNKKGKPWVILNLFNFHCSNPFWSGKCYVNDDYFEAQVSALASILHMVQDSFSLSHVQRGDTDSLESIVVCSSIDKFYTYSTEVEEEHKKADQFPKIKNCNSKEIDDPITASAKILWFAMNDKNSIDVRKYLEKFVF